MPDAKVIFGKSNTIIEHRTPIYIEFEGEKYTGLVIQTQERTFIRWNHRVPDHIRHSSNSFVFEYTKQKVEKLQSEKINAIPA